jgi:hypothetical protein
MYWQPSRHVCGVCIWGRGLMDAPQNAPKSINHYVVASNGTACSLLDEDLRHILSHQSLPLTPETQRCKDHHAIQSPRLHKLESLRLFTDRRFRTSLSTMPQGIRNARPNVFARGR